LRNTTDRKDAPDTVWHVGSRVNWRAWHLVTDNAFRTFGDCFGRALERFGMDLLAFVLMSNHYHAVLRSPPAALYRQLTSRRTRCRHLRAYPPWHSKSTAVGQCLRQFKLDVANRIQRSLGLDGHFWDGKHFRKRVDGADMLVVVMAYDHRNPVREAMVALPEDYARSSAAWWRHGHPAALPLCRRPDLPFGLTFESLRAELLRFQKDKRIDDAMEALAQAGLTLDSGYAELRQILAAAGLEPSLPPPAGQRAAPHPARRVRTPMPHPDAVT
jgi:REP element-mobilizing transposase RayT